jgi:hypothetical protein
MNEGKVIKMDYSQTIPQCLEFLFEGKEHEREKKEHEREKEAKELAM